MDREKWPEGIGVRLGFFAKHFLSILIDAVFLALWVAVQWLGEYVIESFELADVIDRWMLLTFQVILALSTLAPVAIYVYVDIMVMWTRAQKKLTHERHG